MMVDVAIPITLRGKIGNSDESYPRVVIACKMSQLVLREVSSVEQDW
jgi:hypothetical protein